MGCEHSAINFSLEGPGEGTGADSTGYNTKINSFLCPSDGNAGVFGRAGSPNINSYYASIGTTTYIDADCVNPGDTTGVFAYRIAYRLRDVTDGSSNTISFSESLCVPSISSATRGQLIMGAGYTADEVYDVNTLDLTFGPGFTPSAGESFEILQYASETGHFSTIDITGLGPGYGVSLDYGSNGLFVMIEATSVPEPSSFIKVSAPASNANGSCMRSISACNHLRIGCPLAQNSAQTTLSARFKAPPEHGVRRHAAELRR